MQTIAVQPTPDAPHLPISDPLHALVASPRFAEDALCFAARQSGLYRSTDGGRTWTPALDAPSGRLAPTATCAAFAPGGGTGQTVFAGGVGGVLRSRDGGRTWTVAMLPSPPPLVSCLAVSPVFAEDGIVVAGAFEDGIIRSNDRGEIWRRWTFGLLDLGVLALAISPAFAIDETLFAGTETGIFVSTNGGRAWRETPFPEEEAPVLALAISPAFAEDETLYAGTEAHGLWRSADRGLRWDRLDGGAIADAVNAIEIGADSTLLVVLPEAVLLSRSGGASWAAVVEGLREGGGVAACAAPSGLAPGSVVLLARRDGGIRRIPLVE